jgi:Uma2 family endonuclease
MTAQTSLDADAAPIAPTAEVWRAMNDEQRNAFLVRCIEHFEEVALTMGEGRPHSSAKSRVLDLLRRHHQQTRRLIYVAPELAVLYPGERVINPDIIAVLGVEDPGEDDRRSCWSVVDEGKGVDLVIEVLHRGEARKDLVGNVERYARLGIQEYFVYDRRTERVVGWRLAPNSRSYGALIARAGRLRSTVLELDLAVVDSRLRFFSGNAELVDSDGLIASLSKMVDDNVTVFEAAEAARERAEKERDDALLQRDDALLQRDDARATALRDAIRTVLRGRALQLSESHETKLKTAREEDLDRILRAAITASSADGVFEDV